MLITAALTAATSALTVTVTKAGWAAAIWAGCQIYNNCQED